MYKFKQENNFPLALLMICNHCPRMNTVSSGADSGGGGVDWVATTPLGCAVFIILILVWAFSDLLEQAILVNKVYD